jgi:hypothetical protein
MTLKAGKPRSVDGKLVIDNGAIVDTMAGYIDQAMENTYKTMTGLNLPDMGQEDRRILFVAIAQGVLNYLKAHEDELINTIRYSTSSTTYSVQELNLDIQTENSTA